MDKLVSSYKKYKPIADKIKSGEWKKDSILCKLSKERREQIVSLVETLEEEAIRPYVSFKYAQFMQLELQKEN